MRTDTRRGFAEMYEANYSDLLRFVRRRAPEIVDDVVGETFAIAWKRRHEIPDDPRPWLFRTAINVMRNMLRTSWREQSVAAPPEEVLDPISSSDKNLDLISAWRRLQASDRQALALRLWEDLSDSEAAKVLGQTRATYSMRVSRAKRRLAALLRELEDDDPVMKSTAQLKEELSWTKQN